jgi:hypothetical protein
LRLASFKSIGTFSYPFGILGLGVEEAIIPTSEI